MLKKYLALSMALVVSSLPISSSAYDRYGYRSGYDNYHQSICNSPNYTCRMVRGRLVAYPRQHMYRNGDYRRQVAYRSSRRHHQQEREVHTRVTPPSQISGGNIINVNLSNLTWGAYDDSGNLVKYGRVSGGKSYCPDIRRGCRTVQGTFTIYSKRGPECKSRKFPVGKGGAPMPYCMFFKGGYALHGSNAVPNYNASHGCVRMPPSDAQWLNQNFVRVGSTRVHVTY